MSTKKSADQKIHKSESWKMFNRISARYDLLNRLLSLGLDVAWRKRLTQMMPNRPNLKLLDLATGTADVLISLTKINPNIETGTGLDMAEKMLEIGREKIKREGLDDQLTLQAGDANKLPFESNAYDCTTISFGIRNIDHPQTALKEMHRVLNSQGRALVLEFSIPKNPIIRMGHLFYLRTVVPILGWIVSGEYKAYKYLNQTIEDFPYGDDFCELMRLCGFQEVKATQLLFGTATIYQGDK